MLSILPRQKAVAHSVNRIQEIRASACMCRNARRQAKSGFDYIVSRALSDKFKDRVCTSQQVQLPVNLTLMKTCNVIIKSITGCEYSCLLDYKRFLLRVNARA